MSDRKPATHFLIATHDFPESLRALVEALESENIYIHIDGKSDLDKFKRILKGKTVKFLDERINVCWGGWSLVRMQLRLLDQVRPKMSDGDFAVLLSGDCYPLMPASQINKFFDDNREDEFIGTSPMPMESKNGISIRISRFYLEHGFSDQSLSGKIMRLLNKLLRKFSKRNWREGFDNLTPYWGSTWWALSTGAIDLIRGEISDRPNFFRFNHRTLLPDEHFFHTLIANSRLREQTVPPLMYSKFSNGSERADILTVADIDNLRSEFQDSAATRTRPPALFARKVRSEEVRRAIKEKIWPEFEAANSDR